MFYSNLTNIILSRVRHDGRKVFVGRGVFFDCVLPRINLWQRAGDGDAPTRVRAWEVGCNIYYLPYIPAFHTVFGLKKKNRKVVPTIDCSVASS